MHLRPDLSLYDSNGRLAATAEVKNKTGTTGSWAAKTRRNLLAHGFGCDSEFFLLVTPDRLYAWKDVGNDPNEVLPSYEADAGPTFAPYLEDAGVALSPISGQAFELVVAAWLSDLARCHHGVNALTEHDWLEESGFKSAVQDGRVEHETSV